MFKVLSRLSIILLFFLSSNALFALGIGYSSEQGSVLEKIHPAVFFIILTLGVIPFTRNTGEIGAGATALSLRIGCLLAASATIMVLYASLSPNGGSELSAPIVTFLMPGLIVIGFANLGEKTSNWLLSFVFLFFAVNSFLGIFGLVSGFSVLPPVAGSVLVLSDTRPTALLGHPLINAQLTGAMLVFLVLDGLARGLNPSRLLGIALHGTALVCFGGRTALVTASIIVVASLTLQLAGDLFRNKTRGVLYALIMVVVFVVFAFAVMTTGVAGGIIDRFLDDGGSSETRLQALQIIDRLSLEQWAFGLGVSERSQIQYESGVTFGIESFLLSLIVTYGAPIAALVTIVMLRTLYSLAKPLGGIGKWLVAYFFVTCLSSLSLGSKTTTLSLFVVMLLAFRQHVMQENADLQRVKSRVSSKPIGRGSAAAPG